MCWKIIAIITENARNNTHKNLKIIFNTFMYVDYFVLFYIYREYSYKCPILQSLFEEIWLRNILRQIILRSYEAKL
jgi:hypothetical protein